MPQARRRRTWPAKRCLLVSQVASAAPMQISSVAFVCTQNTGAPIRRSLRVPPPTPVTTAKKRKVTTVCRFSAARSAPEIANTAIPNKSSRTRACGRTAGSIVFVICGEQGDEAIHLGRLDRFASLALRGK